MRTEHRQIDENTFQIIRADRGEYDLVFDETSRGWYVETIVDGFMLKSKTHTTSQDAEIAIKLKTVVCDIPSSQQEKTKKDPHA